MAGELAIARLRQYLAELQPQARAMLAAELERALARGDEVVGAAFILDELRRDMRKSGGEVPARIGHPQRMFFAPLDPFLLDMPDRRYVGRLSRACLNPVWTWLGRDLMPAEAQMYSEQVNGLIGTGQTAEAEQVVRTFQDIAVDRMREVLAAARSDEKTERRLGGQIGVRNAVEDLREIHAVLRSRDALALVAARLPPTISNLADEQLENVRALLDSPVGRHRDVFLHALIVVMTRLGSPWQLMRLAINAAGSDVAARIAQTPFAVAVELVLGELDRMIEALRGALEDGRSADAAALVKTIHDAARALHTEMDLSGTPWERQLAAARGEVAEALEAEIEDLPGRVRGLLHPRAARDAVLDETEVAKAEAALDLFGACRTYAGELALSEATRRTYSELQNLFDTGTQVLLDAVRAAPPSGRAPRQSQVEAAARLCGRLFGAEYAAVLTRAADVAARGEPKAAKA